MFDIWDTDAFESQNDDIMSSEPLRESFSREEVCVYKDRRYFVRDNGQVYRQCKDGCRASKLDEVWTFGKFDPNTGYMLIGQERVHRIVCTAFHGEPEGDRNIVDHIDTNRRNNRPDNLRWVTRMENILNNPITIAKVELICGRREAFIENPSLLFGHESEDANFSWMRNVSPEEARASYERWMEWAKKPVEERKSSGGSAGEWLYGPTTGHPDSPFYGFKRWMVQLVDRTEESSFPLAPLSTVKDEDVLQKYREALQPGEVFMICRNYRTEVRQVVFFEQENKLRVLSEKNGGQRVPWYIFEIWADENTIYHKIVGSYGRNRQKDIEEAMHDLTKYHRQEWKYLENRPQPSYHSISEEERVPFVIPEPTPVEVKEYAPAENIEQRSWSTPTEFPMCPPGMPDKPLEAYKQNMTIGDVFCRNRYGESFLSDVGYTPQGDALIILTHQPNGFKQWYLCRVFVENGRYIHESLGSYFEEDGGRKYFTINTGGEWTGGEVYDDGC